MKFVWKYMPPSGGAGAEKVAGGPDVEHGKTALKEQEADLKGYLDRMDHLSDKEKKEFLEKVKLWDRQANATEMRRAGVTSAEDEKDPLRRHILLSAAFLERQKNVPGKMSFKVDFHGSQTAEYKVGAIHLLGPEVRIIKVTNEFGQVVSARAFRGVNPATKSDGFFDEAVFRATGEYKYVPVFTGFTIDVLETGGSNSPAVMRSAISEHVQRYQMPEAGPSQLPGSPLSTFSPGKSVSENLAALEARAGETTETRVDRQRIVDIARKYVNVPREEFRTGDVAGGRLACAKVASTILMEAGFVDQVMLGVDGVKGYLLQHGWTISDEKPEPGDVIVWEPLMKPVPGTINDAGTGPLFVPGHKHIGIAIGPNLAVSNSSSQGMPMQHPIYNGRGVEAILKPPRTMPKSPAAKKPGETADSKIAQNPPGDILHHYSKNLSIMTSDHAENFQHLTVDKNTQGRLEKFREKVMPNRERYEKVAKITHIPWFLIASIHERESGCNFGRYLHNGDPLGKPTTHVPIGKLFYDWESSAIDALKSANGYRVQLGIDENTTDMSKLMSFAEQYNGLGYRNPGRGPSPYVYAGTNIYQGGKFVRDGVYDPNAVDQQLGVAPMLVALNESNFGPQKKNEAVA